MPQHDIYEALPPNTALSYISWPASWSSTVLHAYCPALLTGPVHPPGLSETLSGPLSAFLATTQPLTGTGPCRQRLLRPLHPPHRDPHVVTSSIKDVTNIFGFCYLVIQHLQIYHVTHLPRDLPGFHRGLTQKCWQVNSETNLVERLEPGH